MRVLVVNATVALALLGCSAPDGREPSPSPASPATASPAASPRSLADLPVGRRPTRSYVVGGSSVVIGNHSIDLEWDVEAISGDLVWDEDARTIHRVGPDGIDLLASDATAPPVFGGKFAWIEDDREIVQQEYRGRSRQPLPDGCCSAATVVGYDFDIDLDLFISSPAGSWMWDTYEGGEGLEVPPPDSEDYFWRVGGLGRGTLIETGIASEVLVAYPGGQWGWGFVDGPRDPSSDAAARYEERERVPARRVWLSSRAVIALEPGGRLVELGSEDRDDVSGRYWRGLTGERTAFELPGGLEVHAVAAEHSADSSRRRWTVLVDATDSAGERAWVRCYLRTRVCEIATALGPDDITPQQ